jgi:enolase-phosphatase E1
VLRAIVRADSFRGAVVNDPRAGAIRAVLLDIEGTTTPIAFVTEVLFPYARRHVRPYLEQHLDSPAHESLWAGLRAEHEADRRSDARLPEWSEAPRSSRVEAIEAYVAWLMDRDRKSTGLKELQGRIWEEGYTGGDLVGEVFPDVPAALARWHAERRLVGIFSSGSTRAQRLLFGHSSAGDLTPYLTAYFDTTTGPKAEPSSYARIAESLRIAPEEIVFVSDSVRELDAARACGMRTRLAVRRGNPPASENGHERLFSLEEIA